MSYLKQEIIIQNTVLDQFLRDPSSIKEDQWDQLLEPKNYEQYHKIYFEIGDLNCVQFLCMMGLIEPLKVLADKQYDKFKSLITTHEYRAYRDAASYGHLDVLKFLEEKMPESLQQMIFANGFEPFRDAASHGHLEVVKYLVKKVSGNNLCDMFKVLHYSPFASAARNGHLEVLKYLAETAPFPISLVHMIEAFGYQAYRYGTHEVRNWLLQHPTALAYAEQNREYEDDVNLFIANTLSALHEECKAYTNQTPNGVFDLQDPPTRAEHCFYMIRNLIRRNDRAFDGEIRFLLNIPAVKSLAHQEVNKGQANELLILALYKGNKEAEKFLLKIDAVKGLAEANNYYPQEVRMLKLLSPKNSDNEDISKNSNSSRFFQNKHSNNQGQPKTQELHALLIKAILDFCNKPGNEKVDGLQKMKGIIKVDNLTNPEKIKQLVEFAKWKKSDTDLSLLYHQNIRERKPESEVFYQSLAAIDLDNPEGIGNFVAYYSENIQTSNNNISKI